MTDDKKVKKLGMKDIQRENWEYELTVSLSLDRDTHTAIASKDRTGLFEGKDPFVITEKTGKAILKWCETGVEAPKKPEPLSPEFYAEWQKEISAIGNPADLLTLYNTHAATVSEDEKLKAMFKTKQATFKNVAV